MLGLLQCMVRSWLWIQLLLLLVISPQRLLLLLLLLLTLPPRPLLTIPPLHPRLMLALPPLPPTAPSLSCCPLGCPRALKQPVIPPHPHKHIALISLRPMPLRLLLKLLPLGLIHCPHQPCVLLREVTVVTRQS